MDVDLSPLLKAVSDADSVIADECLLSANVAAGQMEIFKAAMSGHVITVEMLKEYGESSRSIGKSEGAIWASNLMKGAVNGWLDPYIK